MDRLIYSSLSAMRGAMARQTTIANNLANVNTAGFRGEFSSAEALWMKGAGLNSRATVTDDVTGADMGAGAVAATGRDLDVALNGDAMLAVQATDGVPIATPADWQPGQDVIAALSLTDEQAEAKFGRVDKKLPYLRFVAQPARG